MPPFPSMFELVSHKCIQQLMQNFVLMMQNQVHFDCYKHLSLSFSSAADKNSVSFVLYINGRTSHSPEGKSVSKAPVKGSKGRIARLNKKFPSLTSLIKNTPKAPLLVMVRKSLARHLQLDFRFRQDEIETVIVRCFHHHY